MCEIFDRYYEVVVAKHRNTICLCCVLTATFEFGRNKLLEAEYTRRGKRGRKFNSHVQTIYSVPYE